MRVLLAVLLLLVAAPLARADEVVGSAPVADVVDEPRVAPTVPGEPRMHLTELKLPERRSEAASTAEVRQDPFQRGSFWWYVGIIVVAGVILYLLTN